MPVQVVVEGPPGSMNAAVADARSAGWRILPGFRVPPGPLGDVALAGPMRTADDARQVVLAAVAGAGLLVHAVADRDLIDMLCDDLRRFGTLDHRVGDDPAAALSAEERGLLEMLAEGLTLGQAANRLHLARRSADRRLASARRCLGAESSSEAVIAYRERLDRMGRPPC